MAKDGESAILRVQILRVILQIDEPLARCAIRVIAQFRHRYRASLIRNPWLVRHCGIGYDWKNRVSIQPKTSSLNHKARHTPVNDRLVVSASVHIGQKIGNCERRLRIEQLDIDLADIAGKAHHAIREEALP